MPRVSVNGTQLNFESAGDGPALVLIHPNPFDHTIWRYQTARFSLWFRVIAMDLRGYGRSERTTDCSIRTMSDDVAHLLDHLGITRAVVVGLSVGGIIAQEFAVNHPDRLFALIAAGCSASGAGVQEFMDARIEGYSTQELEEYYDAHLRSLTAPAFPGTRIGAYLLETFRERGPTLRKEPLVAIYRGIKAWSVAERLGQVRVPALYIAGEHDPALATTQAASRLVPGAVFHQIPGAGHACCLEAPDEFDRLVLDFLRAHGLLPPPNR
ncbi:MAG: alpha/beta fold hydrolase [candidate division NC10 bacterium]